jgi:hypothetical protein
MMKSLLICAALVAASSASAQDWRFEDGSNARSWNLYAESNATFSGTVVDMTCEITGDCPENCGDGARQLGILRDFDGVLVNVQKNDQALFTGGVQDLLPYCGQPVDVDGLLITDDGLGAINMFLVQFVRPAGTEDWAEAKVWTDNWEAAHPEWAGDGRWYRRAGDIRALLDSTGYFGLGLERDAEIKAEIFE